jgi:hypothetical protein
MFTCSQAKRSRGRQAAIDKLTCLTYIGKATFGMREDIYYSSEQSFSGLTRECYD